MIAFNREVDKATADELSKLFIEIVIAPAYDDAAIDTLKAKKNLRIMTLPVLGKESQFEVKMVRGGALVQESDSVTLDEEKLKVVSKRQPSDAGDAGVKICVDSRKACQVERHSLRR